MMIPLGIGATDTGRKREQNEDAFLVDDDLGLYIVADGMGGHAAGEVASKLAIDTARQTVANKRALLAAVRDGSVDAGDLRQLATSLLQRASQEIHALASSQRDRAGMGCTLTTLIVTGQHAAMSHVGDSRLYLLRAGRVHQLSADHTFAQELFEAGRIERSEIKAHPHAHVLTRAVGSQARVVPDVLVLDLLPGDRFLLCTDGLADYLGEAQSLLPYLSDTDVEEVPDSLIRFANEAGGHDNISVVAVDIVAEPQEADPTTLLSGRTLEALAGTFFLQDASLPQLARVLSACEHRTVRAGETLVAAGSESDGLIVVLTGELQLQDGADRRLHPGDVSGASHLAWPRPARGSLGAIKDSEVLVLRAERFHKLTLARPRLGVRLLERLAGHLGARLAESTDGAS